MQNNTVETTVLTGTHAEEITLVPRISVIPTDSPRQRNRLDFLIKLPFPAIINKANDRTF